MIDEERKNWTDFKSYRVIVNGIILHTQAQSLGQALRNAGDLRLNETSTVTIRVEQ